MLETDILLKGPKSLLWIWFGILRGKGTNEQRASISTNKVSVLQLKFVNIKNIDHNQTYRLPAARH